MSTNDINLYPDVMGVADRWAFNSPVATGNDLDLNPVGTATSNELNPADAVATDNELELNNRLFDIAIIGYSRSGKSTLINQISGRSPTLIDMMAGEMPAVIIHTTYGKIGLKIHELHLETKISESIDGIIILRGLSRRVRSADYKALKNLMNKHTVPTVCAYNAVSFLLSER